MKVHFVIPTRGNPWHETVKAVEEYKPHYERNKLSVSDCRNRIVRDFLQKTDAEILMMCDDDVLPPPGFAPVMVDQLLNGPYDILGAAVPIAKMPKHQVFINAFDVQEDGTIVTTILPERGHKQVGSIGTGLIAIKREVLEHPDLKAPFLQLIDEDGCIAVGQDLHFCNRARNAGFVIGVTMDLICDHYVSLHANSIAWAYKGHLIDSEDDVLPEQAELVDALSAPAEA